MIQGAEKWMTDLKEAVKILRKGRVRERKWRKENREGLYSIYSPQQWPRGGPGTSGLYLYWPKPLRIIILMNIYLYIFLDLFCSEGSCLGWLGYDWTIWLSSVRFWRTGQSPEPQRPLKTGPGIFLWSIIHAARAELAGARQGSEL